MICIHTHIQRHTPLWLHALCVIDLAGGGSGSFPALDTHGPGLITHPWPMRAPSNPSYAGTGVSQSGVNTQSPSPRPFITNQTTRAGGGVCVFYFHLRRCLSAHSRMTWASEVPIDHSLLFVARVCAWSMHIWAGIEGCVCERTRRAIPFQGTLVMKSNPADWIQDGRRYQ